MQYIAYRKLTLETNGELDCEALLSKLGLGNLKPGDKFWVRYIIYFVKFSIQLDHR
jgi:hypothetical protein